MNLPVYKTKQQQKWDVLQADRDQRIRLRTSALLLVLKHRDVIALKVINK